MQDRQGQLDFTPPRKPHFDGETYSPERDQVRLTGQLGDVWAVVGGGGWWTLEGLRHTIWLRGGKKHTEAALSARLRAHDYPEIQETFPGSLP